MHFNKSSDRVDLFGFRFLKLNLSRDKKNEFNSMDANEWIAFDLHPI